MNSNLISLIFVIWAALIALLGISFGWKRGLGRSIIRLVTVILAVVGAFIAKGKLLDVFNNMLDVETIIKDAVGEDMAAVGDLVVPIVEMIVLLVLFFLTFVILRFITLIIYAIFHGLCKKPEKGQLLNKLLGLAVGFVQAVILILCIIAPLSGTVSIAGTLVDTIGDALAALPSEGDEPTENPLEVVDFLSDYPETFAAKTFSTLGGDLLVKKVTAMTDKNGKEITLQGQIKGIQATVKIAASLSSISTINFDSPEDITPDNIREMFANIESLKNGMTEEGMEMVNTIISDVAGPMLEDLNIDLSGFDFAAVDFAKEGDIIAGLMDENVTVDDVAKMMAESDLILDVLEGTDQTFEVSEQEKADIVSSLATVENLDEAKKAQIYSLFGIE